MDSNSTPAAPRPKSEAELARKRAKNRRKRQHKKRRAQEKAGHGGPSNGNNRRRHASPGAGRGSTDQFGPPWEGVRFVPPVWSPEESLIFASTEDLAAGILKDGDIRKIEAAPDLMVEEYARSGS